MTALSTAPSTLPVLSGTPDAATNTPQPDTAAVQFGMPTGPIALHDLIGLDTVLAIARVMTEGYPDRVRTSPLLVELVRLGRLGQKSSAGFRKHDRDTRSAVADPALESVIDRYQHQPTGHSASQEEITDRLFLPMLLEAVRAVLARPAPGPDAPGAQAEPRTNRVGILSGYYPGTRLNSQVNHKAYADAHGYNYIFNASAEKDPRPFYRKFETIARYLHLFEWVFWIDDDAYFTNFEASMDPFIQQAGEADLLICKSPSTKKLFTKISSGQFLLRNSARAHRFLAALMETEMERIRQFWREDLGMFTSGDQDAIVYLSETDPRFGASFMKILDHNEFNNRDFEFKERCNEHFLVHFTGPSPEKNNYKNAFCERMNINPYLVPEPILENYQV